MFAFISFLENGGGVVFQEPFVVGGTEVLTAGSIILSTETSKGKLCLKTGYCIRYITLVLFKLGPFPKVKLNKTNKEIYN